MTKTIYLSSDHHFGHHNIIKYCRRPWQTYWDMDDEIIRRHNSVVSPDDKFIVVGDFGLCSNRSMSRHADILARLNGSPKILILGNHDGTKKKMLEVGFDEVHKSLQLGNVFLLHDPSQLSKQTFPKGSILITGHRHNDVPRFYTQYGYKIINVGVDVWDFYPVDLEYLKHKHSYVKFPKHVDVPRRRNK